MEKKQNKTRREKRLHGVKAAASPKEFYDRLLCRIRLKKAAQLLREAPEKFEGLYEPVYQLIQNPSRPIPALKEWNVRAEFLYPNSELDQLTALCAKSAWSKKEPEKAAKLLMKCIEKAGISREKLDETNELTVTPLQASAYRALDGMQIYAEQTVHVITAAWYGDGRVVEHGMTGEI